MSNILERRRRPCIGIATGLAGLILSTAWAPGALGQQVSIGTYADMARMRVLCITVVPKPGTAVDTVDVELPSSLWESTALTDLTVSAPTGWDVDRRKARIVRVTGSALGGPFGFHVRFPSSRSWRSIEPKVRLLAHGRRLFAHKVDVRDITGPTGGVCPPVVPQNEPVARGEEAKGNSDEAKARGDDRNRRPEESKADSNEQRGERIDEPETPRQRWLRRAAEVSRELLPLFTGLEQSFLERRRDIENGPDDPTAVAALLDVTEADLLAVLGKFEDLGALRAYAKDFFRRSKAKLPASGAVGAPAAEFRPPPVAGMIRLASLAGPRVATGMAQPSSPERGGWSALLDEVGGFLHALVTGARDDQLHVRIESFATCPPLRLCPGDAPDGCVLGLFDCPACTDVQESDDAWRGLYRFRFRVPQQDRGACENPERFCGRRGVACDSEHEYFACIGNECRLDLWTDPGPFVGCSVSPGQCGCRASGRRPDIGDACERDR